MARSDLPTAFHEAGHVVTAWSRGLKIHGATIVPAPAKPASPFALRARGRAESVIVAVLAGPEAQQRHNPRSWRFRHGAADFKQAVDLASRFNGSDEAVRAYLDWLVIVTRDEIEALWPQIETVAHALVRERTLTAAEVKALLARA